MVNPKSKVSPAGGDLEGADMEKITNNELKALGINDIEVLVNFSRVANGLLKHGVMDRTQILANLEALIDDPMPYALKKGGKFKNLAEDVIALRKEGKFVKQQRSIHALKAEIADFPVFGIEHPKSEIRMPVNRNALIRYRTLDACLQNRYKKWTLDDLIDACADALYEYQGINTGVSRRTIQADIEMMRSNKLGYEAPVVVVDKKYYTYSDKAYSITNIPLNNHDMQVLGEVTSLLQQFKGFNHFTDLSEMVSKLEDKIYTQKTHSPPVIDFEKNDNLKGLEWIEVIRKAIVAKNAIGVTYRSFKAKEASTFGFSPYLLKEYRNRWFALGLSHARNSPLLTLALDRVQAIDAHEDAYRENNIINLATYYSDVLGVTKSPNQRDCEVVFWIDNANAPYIITKPIHHTQKMLSEDEEGKIFSIRVIPNFELERELLGFGSKMRVLGPRHLVKQIKNELAKTLERYQNQTPENTEK